MAKRCPSCDFNNRDDAAYCSWCGSWTGDVVELVPVPPPAGARVWLPNYVYAYDPEGGYYPAVEWHEYEVTY